MGRGPVEPLAGKTDEGAGQVTAHRLVGIEWASFVPCLAQEGTQGPLTVAAYSVWPAVSLYTAVYG